MIKLLFNGLKNKLLSHIR